MTQNEFADQYDDQVAQQIADSFSFFVSLPCPRSGLSDVILNNPKLKVIVSIKRKYHILGLAQIKQAPAGAILRPEDEADVPSWRLRFGRDSITFLNVGATKCAAKSSHAYPVVTERVANMADSSVIQERLVLAP